MKAILILKFKKKANSIVLPTDSLIGNGLLKTKKLDMQNVNQLAT